MSGDTYVLDGLAIPATINLLHDLLDEVRSEHPELRTDDTAALETAVVEIAGNLVRHGRTDPPPHYAFRLDVLDDRLRAELAHPGEVEVTNPPHSDPLELSLDESGRGLALAGAMLDELTYRFADGTSTWVMVRSRGPAGR